MERVEACPCCPNGCGKELVYKDFLYQAQGTYYKKWIKVHCGKRVEPTEKELVELYGPDKENDDERW